MTTNQKVARLLSIDTSSHPDNAAAALAAREEKIMKELVTAQRVKRIRALLGW